MVETKVCGKCNLELSVNEFYRDGDRLKNPCKKCRSIISKENNKKWRQTEEGKKKVRESKKRYKSKIVEQNKLIREEKRRQKEILLKERELRRKDRELNKELKLQKKLEWESRMEYYRSDEWKEIKKNKEKERQYNKWKRKWSNDELFAMKVRLRNLIRNSFRRHGYNKFELKTENIVGMDYGNFKEYLESKFLEGMSWENRGEWHIDHVIPLSSAKSEDELIKLCHYSNLQPLWAEDNMKKGDKIL